jgi:uncharacterized membrane protein
MKSITILALLVVSSLMSTVALATNLPVLTCVGTEPFWGIKTSTEGSLVYGNPFNGLDRVYSKVHVEAAAGTSQGYALQLEATDADSSLKLNIVKTECSDGMSDNHFVYTALVDVDGAVLMGCCN